MPRPKSTKPIKSVNTSIRLTPEARELLIKRFGSVSNALAWLARNMPPKSE